MGQTWSNLISGLIVAGLGFSIAQRLPVNGWISGIVGLWMILSAFLPGLVTGGGLVANNLIFGVILAVTGFSVRPQLRPEEREERPRRAA